MQTLYTMLAPSRRRKHAANLEVLHEWALKHGARAARWWPKQFWPKPSPASADRVWAFMARRGSLGGFSDPPLLAGHPFGVAAGFDKDCTATDLWRAIGAGSVEYGTLTAESRPGNPLPRIWTDDEGRLRNRMGLPNQGLTMSVARLRRAFGRSRRDFLNTSSAVSLAGGSIDGMPLDEQRAELLGMLEALDVLAPAEVRPASAPDSNRRQEERPAWVTINMSCPNVPGPSAGPDASDPDPDASEAEVEADPEDSNQVRALEWWAEVGQPILSLTFSVPILFKLPQDTRGFRARIARDIAARVRRDSTAHFGLVMGNAAYRPDGAVSGTAEMWETTLDGIKRMHGYFRAQGVRDRVALVASGGITTPERAVTAVLAGADHVQVYTGLVQYGPAFFRDAVDLLDRKIPDVASD